MRAPKIVVVTGSAWKGAINERLADCVSARLMRAGAAISKVSPADFLMPGYHPQLEASIGVPAPSKLLHKLFRTHDGVVVVTPSYNGSLPPALVNAISWISRVTCDGGQQAAFGRQVFAIGTASPSTLGGFRALTSLRDVLELGLGARVLPQMIAAGPTHIPFDKGGELMDTQDKGVVESFVTQLMTALHWRAASAAREPGWQSVSS